MGILHDGRNQSALGSDIFCMDCSSYRELVSARLDDELTVVESEALDTHLRHCAACTTFATRATALAPLVRVRAADRIPDLVAPILAVARAPRRDAFRDAARLMLAWVAVAELAFALPALVLGDSSGATAHVARHLGSFDVAIAAGLLYAAWRPQRAPALIPVAFVLTGCVIVTAALDLTDGSTSSGLEAHHLVDLVGFALLWIVAGRPLPRRGSMRATLAA
jgi:predicted anti-sigma-YlaC factor YlaD